MKKAIGIILGGISSLIFAASAFAQEQINICPKEKPFSTLCEITSGKIGNVIGPGVQLIFIVAIIIALAYLIWGGIKWIMSGGDKTALEEARNHLVAAIIGLVIIFLVYFVLNILVGFFLPGVSIQNLKLPSVSQ